MQVVAHSKTLWDRFAALPAKSVAEVALVVDPQSARLINDQNPLVAEIYQGIRNKLTAARYSRSRRKESSRLHRDSVR